MFIRRYRGLLGISAVLLAACSATTEVHIFNDLVTQPELDQLAAAFKRDGLKVSQSPLRIPDGIRSPTVILPRELDDHSIISRILDTLASQGHEDVAVELFSLGNHSYTAEHVGVYLTSPARAVARGRPATNLASSYVSACPDMDAELLLAADGSLRMVVFEWDEQSASERDLSLDGSWAVDESEVKVTLSDGDQLSYMILEVRRVEDIGTYTGVELIANNNEGRFASCNFSVINFASSGPR